MLVNIADFKGMAPSVAATKLDSSMAQMALNCRLGFGSLYSLKDLLQIATPSKAGTILSIYKYGTHWFNWISDVDVCKGSIANDAWGRVYFTGGSAFKPQYTMTGVATSGSDYPTVSYDLGLPPPATTPTVAVTGTITDPNLTLVDTRAYVVTYVTQDGAEGPPSPATALIDVAPGQSVNLSAIPVVPSGNYNITTKRLYRTNTGSGGTEYQYVASLAVATTTYNDAIASSALGSILPSTTWDAPPSDLQGIISTPSGFSAGFSGNCLYLSVPYQPHAWPYKHYTDEKIVSIGSYGNSIIVTTEGIPYLFTGSDPSLMGREKLEKGYACVSKRGTVDMGYSVIYPATDGLMIAGTSDVKLITAGLISPSDWQALNPSTIHAYLWEGKYIAFWTNAVSAGFILDPATGDYSLHDIPATAGWHDKLTGKFYIVSAGQIVQWDAAVTYKTGTWKSKKFPAVYSCNLSCAQIPSKTYPLTLKLYADGVLKQTKTVVSNKPFKLVSGFKADEYEFELTGNLQGITGVHVSDSMQELAQI